jgi:hypothetical protein
MEDLVARTDLKGPALVEAVRSIAKSTNIEEILETVRNIHIQRALLQVRVMNFDNVFRAAEFILDGGLTNEDSRIVLACLEYPGAKVLAESPLFEAFREFNFKKPPQSLFTRLAAYMASVLRIRSH